MPLKNCKNWSGFWHHILDMATLSSNGENPTGLATNGDSLVAAKADTTIKKKTMSFKDHIRAHPAYILLRVQSNVRDSFDAICQDLQDQVNTKMAAGYLPHGPQSVNVDAEIGGTQGDVRTIYLTQAMLRTAKK